MYAFEIAFSVLKALLIFFPYFLLSSRSADPTDREKEVTEDEKDEKMKNEIQIDHQKILQTIPEAAILLNHDSNPTASITSMAFPSIMHKDAFLIFRALCKLSMKVIHSVRNITVLIILKILIIVN